MKADKLVARKRVKKEMSQLFRSKKQRLEKRIVWRHKFVCLAYKDQARIPTTDADKEELYQAGLGEKKIAFEELEMSQSGFKELLLMHFPRLEEGGGFQLLKGWFVICITIYQVGTSGLHVDYMTMGSRCSRV